MFYTKVEAAGIAVPTTSTENTVRGPHSPNERFPMSVKTSSCSTQADSHDFVTIIDAASMLKCSADTVRRLINRGELKGYKLGSARAIRIRRRDIDKMLKPITSLAELNDLRAGL